MGAGTSESASGAQEGADGAAVRAASAVTEGSDGAVAGSAGTAGSVGSGGDDGGGGEATTPPPGDDGAPTTSRRFPAVTLDTARPEGGGRAASGDAIAPARQWPLLTVLGASGLGLLIVGLAPFAEAFRYGTILIGVALITGAVLRRILPSVGMLAVRSRFTDMVTYGLLGIAIVMLSLMTQPDPWLEIPFLEDVVHSTVP